MNANHKTFVTLPFGAVMLLSLMSPLLGQAGGRPNTNSTTKTTPTKTPSKTTRPTPPRNNMPAFRPTNPHIELVKIPPGSFMMGSTSGKRDEKPVHQVTINYSFYMGKYEVTQAQWRAVMGRNPSSFNGCGGNCPVEQVSWNDAQEFVKKLTRMNDGYAYRLPSEAEWEYACRAGTTGDYAGPLDEMAWYEKNSGAKTHAVGAKQPNAWGLFDMHGNVSEWCEDWAHGPYLGAPTDGSAWLRGDEPTNYRIVRGGSWYNDADIARSARRSYFFLAPVSAIGGFALLRLAGISS